MVRTAPTTGTRLLAAACAAFVTVPNLGALLGGGEQTERYDTVVTPPDYAFAVWAPIFVACAADAAQRWREPDEFRDGDARTDRPLAAAYALNTAWSITAQRDRFDLTPGLLPAATAACALAYRRLQHDSDQRPSTVLAAGLLLGWTTLASAVNVSADVVRRRGSADDPVARRVALAGAAVAGVVAAAQVATSRRGRLPVAAAAGWGLVTTAADASRPRSARLVAAVGAVGVGAALASPYSSRTPVRVA